MNLLSLEKTLAHQTIPDMTIRIVDSPGLFSAIRYLVCKLDESYGTIKHLDIQHFICDKPVIASSADCMLYPFCVLNHTCIWTCRCH